MDCRDSIVANERRQIVLGVDDVGAVVTSGTWKAPERIPTRRDFWKRKRQHIWRQICGEIGGAIRYEQKLGAGGQGRKAVNESTPVSTITSILGARQRCINRDANRLRRRADCAAFSFQFGQCELGNFGFGTQSGTPGDKSNLVYSRNRIL